jgi:hypothetical protein
MPGLVSLRAALCAAAVVSLASACGSTEPTVDDRLSIASTFGTIGPDASAADMASSSPGLAAGTVHVIGSMRLPEPCYTMTARASSSVGFLVIDVTAERIGGGCAAAISQVSYTADVSGVAPGARTVAVRHTVDNVTRSSTVEVDQHSLVVR